MAPASRQVSGFGKPYTRSFLIFHHTDLSVHRTRLMKESHDRLLHLCSSIDRDFLDIQVPPTKLAKRKKGTFAPPLNHRFLTSIIRHQEKV